MSWSFILSLLIQFTQASPIVASSFPLVPVVDSVEVTAFGLQRTGFEVRFGDLSTDAPVMAMFALPGEHVPIAVAHGPLGQYELLAEGGVSGAEGVGHWTWVAPAKPGLYPIHVMDPQRREQITLNVFVMVPYAAMRRGALNGYRIGSYPRTRRGHEEEYRRPLGFVEVTAALLDAQVSPHFRLGQFVCKQAGGSPSYLVLRQPLLAKLERLLATVNARGIEARTLSIMSAYRTPVYNAAIGNVTAFSRHLYGDAADVFIDEDGDGVMDDLNHDGRHDAADARFLGAIVRETESEPEFAELIGGLGTYGPTPEHGAFMHVDVRGFAVEWGG